MMLRSCTLISSEGYNLIKGTSGRTTDGDLTGNLIGVSPQISVLSKNNSFTFTLPLLF